MPTSTRPFKSKERTLNRINQIHYATVEDAAAGINPLPEIRFTPKPITSVCCLECRTEIRTTHELPKSCPVCCSSLGVE